MNLTMKSNYKTLYVGFGRMDYPLPDLTRTELLVAKHLHSQKGPLFKFPDNLRWETFQKAMQALHDKGYITLDVESKNEDGLWSSFYWIFNEGVIPEEER